MGRKRTTATENRPQGDDVRQRKGITTCVHTVKSTSYRRHEMKSSITNYLILLVTLGALDRSLGCEKGHRDDAGSEDQEGTHQGDVAVVTADAEGAVDTGGGHRKSRVAKGAAEHGDLRSRRRGYGPTTAGNLGDDSPGRTTKHLKMKR
jgi:hypothetical protein